MIRFLALAISIGLSTTPTSHVKKAAVIEPESTTLTLRPSHIETFGMFEPEWQIHAKWCTTDRGSSHGAYMATCAAHDQFDSVVACQSDAGNGDAVQKIRDAGRATVNQFMDNYKPTQCK